MKIGEKIQNKMKERGFESIPQLYRAIQEVYAEESITLTNLYRIVNNHTPKPRLKNISQIATILACPVSEFYKEIPTQAKGVFYINEGAKIVNLNDSLEINPKKILLKMGRKTFVDPGDLNTSKFVYVFSGEIILHLLRKTGEEKVELSTAQHYTFDGSIPHFYESLAKRGGRLLVITNHGDASKR